MMREALLPRSIVTDAINLPSASKEAIYLISGNQTPK